MSVENQEELKQRVLKSLYETFPCSTKIVGGIDFLQDIVNEAVKEL